MITASSLRLPHRRLLAVMSLLTYIGACTSSTSPEPAVTLSTDRTEYIAGSSGMITLKANTRIIFGYCPVLEQRSSGRWIDVKNASPENCPSIGRSVEAGSSADLPFELPISLRSGTFRLRVSIGRDEVGLTSYVSLDRSGSTTNEFSVRALSS